MVKRIVVFVLVLLTIVSSSPADEIPWIGIDGNYAVDMAARGKGWSGLAGPIDPETLFVQNGCRHARIRLWVGDEGMNRLNYATTAARRAREAGLKPHLVIFLSEDWADFVKQPAPAIWKNLPSDEKLKAIEAYSERVVRHMAEQGVEIDTFEIGNEIDFGICGEFEEEWPRRVSLEYMRTRIWPRMTPILKAAQAGVLKAQPKAKFIIHLTQWNNIEYCLPFWQAMQAAGVRVDIPGLSYFPSSAKESQQRQFTFLQEQVARIAKELKKPVLICETGYPSSANFGGQFAEWNLAADGYPLTEAGQAQWIADLVKVVAHDRNFAGVIYWSPEWYDGGLWDAFALFDSQGVARQGARSFKP